MSALPQMADAPGMAERRAVVDAALDAGFVMPREIRTERLTLAQLALHHLPPFERYWSDPDTTRFVGGVQDLRGAWNRLARFAGAWWIVGAGMYALHDRAGQFVGFAGLWLPFEKPEMEIGYHLMPEARGNGYAAEAARAIRAIAEAMGAPSLVSYIAPENAASQRVASAAGAVKDMRVLAGGFETDVWRYPCAAHPVPGDAEPIVWESRAMPLTIRTARLHLGPWRREHFARFEAHLADPDTMRFIGGPQDRYGAARIFFEAAGQWALRGYGVYAVEHEGRLVGGVGLYHPAGWPEAEIAYNITTDARRNGFAAEAAKAVRDVAAEQGRRRLVSFIHPDNGASIAVARRLGAQHEGMIQFAGDPDMVWAHALPEPRDLKIHAEIPQPAL